MGCLTHMFHDKLLKYGSNIPCDGLFNPHRMRPAGPDGAEAHGRIGTLDRSDFTAWAQMDLPMPMEIYD